MDKGVKERRERRVGGRMEEMETRQSKLVIEEGKKGKKVSFLGIDKGEESEVIKGIRKEVKQEMENLKEEWNKKIKGIEDRLLAIEKYIIEKREEDKRKEEEERERREREASRERSASMCSRATSRDSSSVRQGSMVGSDVSHFSEGEVRKIKKMMWEKEKEERMNNIVIKGLIVEGSVAKEKVEEFLNDKLEVAGRVRGVRLSGKVLVVVLESEEMKRKVMSNKNKLKGGNIFIENDLTWEERKIQERIGNWAREERKKGKEVKIGLGKVRINGMWRRWHTIEDEIERNGAGFGAEIRGEVEREGYREERGKEQNFAQAKK